MPDPLLTFVEELFVTGRVRLTSDEPPADGDINDAILKVREFESSLRLDLPGTPPDEDEAALRWALVAFYQACQFQVYRHLGMTKLAERLADDSPRGATAEAHYSVDLVFRFLPDLMKLARSGSSEDPLLVVLTGWCERWPLSSVGVSDLNLPHCEPILTDECLLRLYVDRILRTQDTSRFTDQRIRIEVSRAVGAFPELGSAPEFTSA